MKRILVVVFALAIVCTISPAGYAQPYGTGTYGEISYGDMTSLSISTDGDVTIPTITPTESGSLGTGTSTITVVSSDVTGYKLYINALNDTDMDNLGTPLPASSNIFPSNAALSVNTWGYNIDQSSNFAGITLLPVEIDQYTSATSEIGRNTVVKYGLYVDMVKPAGQYVAEVVYTAVPQTN